MYKVGVVSNGIMFIPSLVKNPTIDSKVTGGCGDRHMYAVIPYVNSPSASK
jgi:hypothetical protein